MGDKPTVLDDHDKRQEIGKLSNDELARALCSYAPDDQPAGALYDAVVELRRRIAELRALLETAVADCAGCAKLNYAEAERDALRVALASMNFCGRSTFNCTHCVDNGRIAIAAMRREGGADEAYLKIDDETIVIGNDNMSASIPRRDSEHRRGEDGERC